MNIIKVIIYFTLLFGVTSTGLAEECIECAQSDLVKGECFEVKGMLFINNGWPPYMRIETESKDKLFGVGPNDNEIVPTSIKAVIPTSVEKTFVLCSFEQTTKDPNENRIIEMVCIKSVKDAWYFDKYSGEKKKLE